MASADFRFDIRTPREARSQWHQIGSPQVRHTSFLPVHRIYVSDSCMSIGHWVTWPAPPSEPPHIRFLFVEHAFCYRLPPDLVLPLRHCRVANPSPHRAGSGFAPYRSAPCWAHPEKRRGIFKLAAQSAEFYFNFSKVCSRNASAPSKIIWADNAAKIKPVSLLSTTNPFFPMAF